MSFKKKPSEISDELRKFVLTSIPSIPFLESLLLLRQDPARAWTSHALSQRLFVSDARAAEILMQLQSRAMARQEDDRFVYAAAGELDRRIAALADLYRADLLAVTDLIHSAVDRRAYQFADAFKLRKD